MLVLAGFASDLRGQLTPEISKKLRSPDLTERLDAYESLVAEKPLSAAAVAALVELLLREDLLTAEINRQGLGTDDKYGEGYGLYVAGLGAVAQSIAEREPDRADVWPALVHMPYNPGSVFAIDWLPKYGDKVTPLLLAETRDPLYRETSGVWDALARIAMYERQPSNDHKLKAKDVEVIETTIRGALDDKSPAVRSNAVDALAIIGSREDVAVLERIALTDPAVVTNGGPTGADIRFFVREEARAAAEQLRKRLDKYQPVQP